MPRVLGSPDKLSDEIIDKIRSEIETKMREALIAARQIIDKAYEESRKKLEEELRHMSRDARERVSSFSAKWEVEHRKKLAELRSKAVEDILAEALSKLRGYVGEEAYTEFLARMLNDAFSKLPEGVEEVDIIPVKGDEEYVKKALRKASKPKGVKVEVAEEFVEGLGGFIIRTRGGGFTLDYRLDVVLAPVIEETRTVILKTLLGGEGTA
jgi:V/A-type H+-transporting ATPase subunit E